MLVFHVGDLANGHSGIMLILKVAYLTGPPGRGKSPAGRPWADSLSRGRLGESGETPVLHGGDAFFVVSQCDVSPAGCAIEQVPGLRKSAPCRRCGSGLARACGALSWRTLPPTQPSPMQFRVDVRADDCLVEDGALGGLGNLFEELHSPVFHAVPFFPSFLVGKLYEALIALRQNPGEVRISSSVIKSVTIGVPSKSRCPEWTPALGRTSHKPLCPWPHELARPSWPASSLVGRRFLASSQPITQVFSGVSGT